MKEKDPVGMMAVPVNFRYREVLKKGKPKHERSDDFRIRHPLMDVGHRAKIFAPFDALKGFSEELESAKNLQESAMEPETEKDPEILKTPEYEVE